MMKRKFYGVAVGRVVGVFHTWEETEESVRGYPNARHMSFATEAQALSFVANNRGAAPDVPKPLAPLTGPGHEITIGAYSVRFPFVPYTAQATYMDAVLRALDNTSHAALESPTGTGKTLSLLCASCAWLIEARKQGDTTTRIMYSTRTHAQVSQVMAEFRRCAYSSALRSTVLASREHLCVNDLVRASGTRASINTSCNLLKKSAKGCDFYDRVQSAPMMEGVMDVESLGAHSRKHLYCPYYATREKGLTKADIVFCPYNFALDPMMGGDKLELQHYIVIIDEAHNIPNVCTETESIDLSVVEIMQSVGNLERANGIRGHDSFAPAMKCLSALGAHVGHMVLPTHSASRKTAKVGPGEGAVALMESRDITDTDAGLILKACERAIEVVMEDEGDVTSMAPLEKVGKFFKLLYGHEGGKAPDFSSYRFIIHDDDQQNRFMCMWCLDAGVAMKRLEKRCRNIILTSGTLSPMASFTTELEITFGEVLQGGHVIGASQVAAYACKEAFGARMNGSYERRNDHDYISGVLQCIANLARAVPDGLLVFFPSYGVMDSMMRTWQSASSEAWAAMIERKPVFVEPKNQQECNRVIDKYHKTVTSGRGGAILFAVCRGKMSEGMDFKDGHGRCAVVVGVPFAARYELRVCLQKSHIDEKHKGSKTYNGSVWYRQEAIRATNQAVGRVIRHKDDYGAVVLLDERYASMVNELSRWLQPYLECGVDFGKIQFGLMTFFKRTQVEFATPAKVETTVEPTTEVAPRHVVVHDVDVEEPPLKNDILSKWKRAGSRSNGGVVQRESSSSESPTPFSGWDITPAGSKKRNR